MSQVVGVVDRKGCTKGGGVVEEGVREGQSHLHASRIIRQRLPLSTHNSRKKNVDSVYFLKGQSKRRGNF